MNYFAEIQNDVVTDVIVIDENDCENLSFPESEPIGQAFVASLGITGEWLQTSLNGKYRAIYAGIGYTYDRDLDVFVMPPEKEPDSEQN